MSDPTKGDTFDKDYWFEMYQDQCAATDEWAKKYSDEVERKADATLLARCAELQRIAEVANAMVGKSRDQIESQAKRIAELEAEVAALRPDAEFGRFVKHFDIQTLELTLERMKYVFSHPEEFPALKEQQ